MKIQRIACGDMTANCYALTYGDKISLIDPGDGAPMLINYITKQNLTLEYILLTHGHFDHTGAVKELLATFPNCKVAIGKGNEVMLSSAVESAAEFFGLEDAERYMFPYHLALGDGDTFMLGDQEVKVIAAPGHSRGDICYVMNNILFTGDVLFEECCGRADLPGGDEETLQKSLYKLRDLEGNYQIFAGHGEMTTMDSERKYNPYLR